MPRLISWMPEPDSAIVARARGGDLDAFRHLVERYSRQVYRVAYRMTANCHDAEDIVQETFLKAYRQLDRFESRASFGTWVHRIAVNCAVDLLRTRPHRAAIGSDDALERTAGPEHAGGHQMMSPERLMASTELAERVRSAMTGLSALERAAFTLRHLEGESIDEISRVLGIRANAAKHCVFRAVRKLRVALEPFVERGD